MHLFLVGHVLRWNGLPACHKITGRFWIWDKSLYLYEQIGEDRINWPNITLIKFLDNLVNPIKLLFVQSKFHGLASFSASHRQTNRLILGLLKVPTYLGPGLKSIGELAKNATRSGCAHRLGGVWVFPLPDLSLNVPNLFEVLPRCRV